MSDDILAVFARRPTPGLSKTRLGASPEWNAAVAEALLRDTLTRLAGAAARRFLAGTPSEQLGDLASLAGPAFTVVDQGDGDLGQRLLSFIDAHWHEGARIVIIGSDSPTVPVEWIGEAFALLRRVDVVLGPATDGGYYLVGCSRPVPIFDGIPWSSGDVLAKTVERLQSGPWSLALLPPWYDIDTPESWAMLRGHVAALRRAGIDPGIPHTEALLRS